MAADLQFEKLDKKQIGDADDVLKACTEVEGELAELRAQYEQYFLGLEKLPPTKRHERVKKQISLMRNTFVRQTSVKFRVQNLAQKLSTYERLWERTLKEIENGTYSRELYRARRHRKPEPRKDKEAAAASAPDVPDEDLDLSDLDESDDLESALAAASAAVQKPAPKTSTPSPAPPPRPGSGGVPSISPLVATPPPVTTPSKGTPAITPALSSPPVRSAPTSGVHAALSAQRPGSSEAGGLSDQKIKAIYDAYVTAKKRCGEDTRNLTFDSVSATLKKQVPELLKQHKAKSVEFKVVIKDGKAVLRALPKE